MDEGPSEVCVRGPWEGCVSGAPGGSVSGAPGRSVSGPLEGVDGGSRRDDRRNPTQGPLPCTAPTSRPGPRVLPTETVKGGPIVTTK